MVNGGILRSSKIPGSRGTTPKVGTSAPLLLSLLDVMYCRVTALDSCRMTELSGDCLY